MDERDKQDVRDIVDDAAKHYFPITRINFSQIIQGLMLAILIWIGAEFKKLGDKSIQRETELLSLKADIQELKAEVIYLRTMLYEKGIFNGKEQK